MLWEPPVRVTIVFFCNPTVVPLEIVKIEPDADPEADAALGIHSGDVCLKLMVPCVTVKTTVAYAVCPVNSGEPSALAKLIFCVDGDMEG